MRRISDEFTKKLTPDYKLRFTYGLLQTLKVGATSVHSQACLTDLHDPDRKADSRLPLHYCSSFIMALTVHSSEERKQ
jgi:hypothetical protein